MSERPNAYDAVASMERGTVFQFGAGAPWLRTGVGVRDLIPFLVDRDHVIPESWRDYGADELTVLYDAS